ncbi:MAG: serine/threonine protein kinase [Lachnospiraceae bacterium]|nr:serine/threonine protein kinase [Lachnospiraceae bacterium]
MNLTDRTALSFYRPVADIRPEHGICLVQHSLTGKFYVLKRLTVYNSEIYQMLLAHPISGTPHVYEAVEADGMLTVIEEYLPGSSLQELLDDRGCLPEPQVIDIISQLLSIVRTLPHASPAIIHRDIKPSNVIISEDGIVKLLDFNAAKFASGNKCRDTALLGTSGFAAPEQYGFAPSGVQTDLYSIGVLMNVLLTGVLPSEHLADGKLSGIIAKCTQMDPRNRYSDADSLLTALKEMQTGMPANNSEPSDSEQNPFLQSLQNIPAEANAKKEGDIPENGNLSSANTWWRFLPPGFRKKNPLHTIIAIIGYLLLFYCTLNLTVETDSIAEIILNRLAFCLSGLGIIFFSCNYLDVQSHLSLSRSSNRLVRIIGVILYDAVILFTIVFILIIVLALMGTIK